MREWRMSIGTVVVMALLGTTGAPTIAQEAAEPVYAAVSGTVDFVERTEASVLEQSETVPQVRGEGYEAVVTVWASDPRLSGRLEATSNYIELRPGLEGGLLRSGRGRLSNDGGSWLAEFHGFAQLGTSVYFGSHYSILLTGENGYEGLSAMLLFLPTGGGEWDLEGVLFPGPIPEFPPPLPPLD